MQKRSILITGCSSGIGYTCAVGMRQRGWRVIATARNHADLDMLTERGLEPLQLDYCDPRSIANCADDCLRMTDGKLDALFNNGAYGQPGLVEDLPVEALRKQFEANFFGWHDLTIRLLPAMRAQGHGRIVQCSSVLGFMAAPYRGAYNASKFALEGLTDTLRMELANTGIHVISIQPGPIRSRFTLRALNELKANIDYKASPRRSLYEARMKALAASAGPEPTPLETPEESRRNTGGGLMPKHKLGPDAVFDCLVHATESATPKFRYRVTYSTKVAAWARRLLPGRLQQKLVLSSS
jgi:NAD(P)-dependent dehydrogenase (short-subunit alcohol dehydrogenase family)